MWLLLAPPQRQSCSCLSFSPISSTSDRRGALPGPTFVLVCGHECSVQLRPVSRDGQAALCAGHVPKRYCIVCGGAPYPPLSSTSPPPTPLQALLPTTRCLQVDERKTAELTCPNSTVISSVDFAAYGLPVGERWRAQQTQNDQPLPLPVLITRLPLTSLQARAAPFPPVPATLAARWPRSSVFALARCEWNKKVLIHEALTPS